METTKKTVSDDVIIERFISRYGRFPFDGEGAFIPEEHILYVRSEDALYVFQDGAFTLFDDEMKLMSILANFLKTERDRFTPDPYREDLKPLHPDFSINVRVLQGLVSLFRVRIAAVNAIDSIESSMIAFQNNVTVDSTQSPLVPIPSSPALRAFTKLPVEFSENVKPPEKFIAFLRSILINADTNEPDESLISIVQEMFGYCLLPTIEAQTAFFLVGSGANGKSTLLNVLASFFDQRMVSAIRLSDMTGSSFAVSELVGKKLNIMNEEESKYVQVDTLKHLISGEPVMAMRKYKSAVYFVPRTKFLWATNDVPSFDKIDAALRRRLIFIPFNRTIPINERNPYLSEELKKEIVPILFWSLEGAKRLVENKFRFTQSFSTELLKKNVRIDRFPSLEFLEEQYEITNDADAYVPTATLYDRYRLWCDKNGFSKTSIKTFVKQIIDFDDRIKTSRKYVNGSQISVKTNLKLRPDAEPLSNEYGFSSSQEKPF